MSGEDRRPGAPQGPPWSLEVVADFHADALDAVTTEELRPRLLEEPEAAEVLAALDATRADLDAFARDDGACPLPDDVAARIETALADEARTGPSAAHDGPAPRESSVVDLDAALLRSRRTGGRSNRRRFGWTAAVVASAAAVLGAVALGTPVLERTSGEPHAIEPKAPAPAEPGPLALRGEDVTLSGRQLASVLGTEQYTATLSDPERLIACLQANGVDSGTPMGAREITVDGRPAQLLVLPTGEIGRFRLLAVGPRCGPGNPATISDTTVGG